MADESLKKENEQQQKIDIDQILKDKAGKKAKFIPWFVKRWLKKTLHQDEVNRFLLGRAAGKYGVDFLDECVDYLEMDNDLLMNLKGLAPLCIPINKTGSQSRDFPRMVEAAFQSDNNVLMFPAGLCSRKQDDGTIRDLPWKKTFVTKSIEYKRDVIPVHFSGHNSDKFYNIARFCKKHKLKFNFAMLYLVDEMYKNVGKHFTVTFGEPIPWQTFTDKSKTHAQWAQWVQDKVYEL